MTEDSEKKMFDLLNGINKRLSHIESDIKKLRDEQTSKAHTVDDFLDGTGAATVKPQTQGRQGATSL